VVQVGARTVQRGDHARHVIGGGGGEQASIWVGCGGGGAAAARSGGRVAARRGRLRVCPPVVRPQNVVPERELKALLDHRKEGQ
jgi:hypothetical protein